MMAFNVSPLIPLPGPLIATDGEATSQQSEIHQIFMADVPVVLPSTNLVEKYDLSDPLLARLVEVSTVLLAAHTSTMSAILQCGPLSSPSNTSE